MSLLEEDAMGDGNAVDNLWEQPIAWCGGCSQTYASGASGEPGVDRGPRMSGARAWGMVD